MKNPGKIVQFTDKNGKVQKAIAYNSEQKSFIRYKKVFLHLVDDNLQPIKDSDWKKILSLNNVSELTIIGYVD